MNSSAPPVRLAWSALTHRGTVRANNEDAFLALNFDGHGVNYLGKVGTSALETSDFVFAVSDGMGGARSGEFASRIAVDRITKLLPRGFRLAAGGLKAGYYELLAQLVAEIHEDLLRLGRSYEECAGMGATLSLVWLMPGAVSWCHVGDSRIYYLAGGAGGAPTAAPLVQLTHDHTHVGWLRRTGQISEREARVHPRRSALGQALGAGQQIVEPQISAMDCQAGDRFLLCTDGLTDGLWDHHLDRHLRSPEPMERLAPLLVEAALELSGRDNLTAIVVDVLPGPAPEASR
jgi:serine/threonine protein phosphatase PrpC